MANPGKLIQIFFCNFNFPDHDRDRYLENSPNIFGRNFRSWARPISGKFIHISNMLDEFSRNWSVLCSKVLKSVIGWAFQTGNSSNQSSSWSDFEQNWIGTYVIFMDKISRNRYSSWPENLSIRVNEILTSYLGEVLTINLYENKPT